MDFDWHAGPITRSTPLDKHYRNTHKVRQFLIGECGEGFKFDRVFMAWIKSGEPSTMGDVADQAAHAHLISPEKKNPPTSDGPKERTKQSQCAEALVINS